MGCIRIFRCRYIAKCRSHKLQFHLLSFYLFCFELLCIFAGLRLSLLHLWRITKDIYDKKIKEYKEKQADIDSHLAQYTKVDESFYLDAARLLELVKRASKVFVSSEPETKRQICNFLLQNCKLDGKKLDFELKTPFNWVLKANISSDWLRD